MITISQKICPLCNKEFDTETSCCKDCLIKKELEREEIFQKKNAETTFLIWQKSRQPKVKEKPKQAPIYQRAIKKTYVKKLSLGEMLLKQKQEASKRFKDSLPATLSFEPKLEVIQTVKKIYGCDICKDSHKIKAMTQFGIVTKDCVCKKSEIVA